MYFLKEFKGCNLVENTWYNIVFNATYLFLKPLFLTVAYAYKQTVPALHLRDLYMPSAKQSLVLKDLSGEGSISKTINEIGASRASHNIWLFRN